MLNSNTWNQLNVCKQISSNQLTIRLQITYKQDLALDNTKEVILYKTFINHPLLMCGELPALRDVEPNWEHNQDYWKVIPYYIGVNRAVRVFANGPGDLGSIPGRVIPKTQKLVLDASLLNTQHYKGRIKGKVE